MLDTNDVNISFKELRGKILQIGEGCYGKTENVAQPDSRKDVPRIFLDKTVTELSLKEQASIQAGRTERRK